MRYVHVCTSHGCAMPALAKAADAAIAEQGCEAQLAKGRRRPVRTEVGRYVETRAPALARALEKVLQRHAERIAEAASRLMASELSKDFKAVSRRQRILDELALDDLGLDLNGQLVGPMLAAFKRAARLGLTQVGFDMDEDITDQVDEAAVEWADARGGALIKDLAGTTRDAMQRVLARAVDEGMSVRELGKAILRMGAFSAARATLIATTELARAHVQGNVQGWRQTGEVVGKRWILADTHPEPDVCDEAAEMGVVGLDDEFLPGIRFPPDSHPACCLPGTLVAPAGQIAAHFARAFDGEVIDIRTARSHLAVTPNHPILTHRGWVAAGALEVGDLVMEAADPGAASRLVEPHDQNMPARIEEVADALLVAGGVATRGMPTASEAFHGDGMTDGEVDVVWAAGTLAQGIDAGEMQRAAHATLGGRDARRRGLASERDGGTFGLTRGTTTRSNVGSLGHLPAPLGRPLGAGQQLHLREGADGQAVALEHVSQRRAVAADSPREFNGGFAGHVPSMQPGDVAVAEPALASVGLPLVAQRDNAIKQTLHDLVRDAHLPREAADRLASLVTLGEITNLSRRHFDGTVHNISTRYGWYFADGIAVHNCLCDVLPVLRDDDKGPP